MPTQKKIDTVTKLSEKIARAKAVVFADYRGLKHKQTEELRKTLKKVQAEFTVAKNRLMLKALRSAFTLTHRNEQGKRHNEVDDSFSTVLTDTTATLFSYADEVAPLKELLKYFKTAGFGTPKGGLLGDTVLSDADVTRLAGLATRPVLLAQLVGQLNAPIQGLHYALNWNLRKLVYALNALKEQKKN